MVATGPGIAAPGSADFLAPVDRPAPHLTLLGGFGLHMGCEPVSLTQAPQRLLALLALHGSGLRRGYVAGLLWGDSTEARANGCLRSALWKLRGAGLRVIRTYGDCLELAPDVSVDVDQAASLARTVVVGRFCEEVFALLEPCFSAELLPGWHDEWLLAARERHRQLSLHALEMLCEHLTRIGSYGAAIMAGLAAVDREPLRESAHRALMKVHLAEGNAAEAIRRYRQYETIAARDLGVGPTIMMRTLLDEIAPLER